MNNATGSKTESTVVAAAVSVVAIVLLGARIIAQVKFPELKFDDATTIALVVFAAVPWLARLSESIKFEDFEFRFLNLEKQQHDNDLREHAK